MLKTFDLVNKTSSSFGISIFLTMSITFIILTFIILKFNWNFITKFIKKSNRIFILFKISLIMQICLSILLVLLNSQIIFLHYYSINILMISLLGSYSLSFFILFFLTYKFLHWFSIKKNYIMLFYSLAFGTIFLESISKLAFTEFMMMLKPEIIFPMTIGSSIYIPYGSIQGFLNDFFSILSILSFVFSWIASAIMLKEYLNKLGQLKYWIIVSIPLIFYIGQFFVLANSQIIFQLTSNLTSLTITLTIIFILSNLIGSLLFGIPFWIIAKTIQNSVIRTSMTIAGFGFVFLFLTNQAHGIILSPYPPYGIITSLYFGLSSFLLMVGFYCSALYMSENQDIRRLIRKDILKYDLLSQMSYRFIEDKTINYINQINKSAKHELFTNYNELFLKDEEIKHYVKSVINEISMNKEEEEDDDGV